jgi:hypothetical protein
MESESIKKVVYQVGRIASSGDRTFQQDDTKNLASTLLVDLTRNFRKSPTMAVAAAQYLMDAGFDFARMRGSAYTEFAQTFGPRMRGMTPAHLEQVRKIGGDLFNQAHAA